MKEKLARSVQAPGGLDFLLEEINSASSAGSALAFLATSVKEFGAVSEASELYAQACLAEPHAGSYTLNYTHTLEVRLVMPWF